MAEPDNKKVAEIINQLSDAGLADTVGLMMQNAITIQQAMQTVTNASVSSSCALILKQGGG
ncbi:RebB family R body protein [Pseudoalteromonas denitrificans]|uniref:Killing trait domain-containing protein n=1 Tax=Pseudoalteromonas denitrificans DSM 6059 TaxID=1123010 RepID=A0A1I1SYS9_9GAMM|nr:RebB family R body protein [Pseudoalteromonas denitrificans]SFD51614.1 Killing trait domain-containing protein [Pseudoalteromonas denitrificans DSM 6059]